MAGKPIGRGWNKTKDGKDWLSLSVDLGILGNLNVNGFKVEKEEGDKKPSFRLVCYEGSKENGEKSHDVGALWEETSENNLKYLKGFVDLSELNKIWSSESKSKTDSGTYELGDSVKVNFAGSAKKYFAVFSEEKDDKWDYNLVLSENKDN